MLNKTNHFIHRPLSRCDGIVRDAEYTEKGNHDSDRNSKTTEFRSHSSHLRCRRSVVITGTARCLECWPDTSFSASGQHIYLPSAISAALAKRAVRKCFRIFYLQLSAISQFIRPNKLFLTAYSYQL